MKFRFVLPLLLAAAAITPASANWFSNPALGINRNVGSAPSPTPEQVRASRLPPYVLRNQVQPVTVADAAAASVQQTVPRQPAQVQPAPQQPLPPQAPAR